MINSISPFYNTFLSEEDNIDQIKDMDTIKHPIGVPKKYNTL